MTPLVTFLLLASFIQVDASRKYLNVSGDILLGALFPIHGKGGSGENCGRIKVGI